MEVKINDAGSAKFENLAVGSLFVYLKIAYVKISDEAAAELKRKDVCAFHPLLTVTTVRTVEVTV